MNASSGHYPHRHIALPTDVTGVFVAITTHYFYIKSTKIYPLKSVRPCSSADIAAMHVNFLKLSSTWTPCGIVGFIFHIPTRVRFFRGKGGLYESDTVVYFARKGRKLFHTTIHVPTMLRQRGVGCASKSLPLLVYERFPPSSAAVTIFPLVPD